jgi:hypothetical protein
MSKPMSDGGKGSVRRNEDTEAYRNNFDNIFRKDKKEPEMINEDDYDEHEHDMDDEVEMCDWCNGTGEGRYDGDSCAHCRGTGLMPFDGEEDDSNYPD